MKQWERFDKHANNERTKKSRKKNKTVEKQVEKN